MPRLATLIAGLALALPGTALAQGAGDDQYREPRGDETGRQQGSGQAQSAQDGGLSESPPVPGDSDSGSGSGSDTAGGKTDDAGTATTPEAPGGAADTGPAQASGRLPNTGSDPRALLLCGLAFVLIGLGLRLRTIDPDAY